MIFFKKKQVYYNLNVKITSVKKWIEKKLENEYIRYFKYDEFIIDEEEIGRGRDIQNSGKIFFFFFIFIFLMNGSNGSFFFFL
jgi:hypothetical protein